MRIVPVAEFDQQERYIGAIHQGFVENIFEIHEIADELNLQLIQWFYVADLQRFLAQFFKLDCRVGMPRQSQNEN